MIGFHSQVPASPAYTLGQFGAFPAFAPEPAVSALPLYSLPTLSTLRLRVELKALSPARLPAFHGSMLRGAFGHALRKAVCSVGPRGVCASCRLRHDCAYARIFESPIEPGTAPPLLRGLPSAPHPYVFEPRSTARELLPGGVLPFDLLLFGRAIDHQARALWAIEQMAAGGLGAGRAPFSLSRVAAETPGGTFRPLFAEGAWISTSAAPGRPLPCDPLPGGVESRESRESVRLRFATPLRIQTRGKIVAPETPRALVFSMLRRVLELAHFHARFDDADAIDWHFRPLLQAASRLRFAASHVEFVDGSRYSHRQDRRVELGGYVGTLDLEGDLAPFAPLLRAAEVLHVGKGAVFGLGKVTVETVPN